MIFKEVVKGGYVQRPVWFMTRMVGALPVFPACLQGPHLSLSIQPQLEPISKILSRRCSCHCFACSRLYRAFTQLWSSATAPLCQIPSQPAHTDTPTLICSLLLLGLSPLSLSPQLCKSQHPHLGQSPSSAPQSVLLDAALAWQEQPPQFPGRDTPGLTIHGAIQVCSHRPPSSLACFQNCFFKQLFTH